MTDWCYLWGKEQTQKAHDQAENRRQWQANHLFKMMVMSWMI